MAIKDGEFTYIKATGPIIEFDDEDDEDDEDAGAHGAKRSAAEEKDAKKGERGANGAAAVLSKKATLDAAPGSEIKGAAPRTARRLPGKPDKIMKAGSLTTILIARKSGGGGWGARSRAATLWFPPEAGSLYDASGSRV